MLSIYGTWKLTLSSAHIRKLILSPVQCPSQEIDFKSCPSQEIDFKSCPSQELQTGHGSPSTLGAPQGLPAMIMIVGE